MSTIPNYTIVRSPRKTVSLHILPNGSLEVRAPRLLPEFFIKRFVEQHADWIDKNMKVVTMHKLVTKKTYKSGDELFYLGQKYVLDIGSYTEIHVVDRRLCFPRVSEFRIQKELTEWYQKQAKQIITGRVKANAELMNVSYKELYFSDTKSKWGSCSPDNRLQFNWRLIMAPLLVLNYVVIHELAHTVVKNHSARFWKKVEEYNPSYKQQRLWLKKNGGMLSTII